METGDAHPAQRPFVSVIVPVRDDGPRLALCLEALRRQDYPRECFELIVVDNGSADSSPDVARALADRVEHEGRPGSYAARNRGLAVAQGQLIAFTDSDCIPEPDWLRRGVERLQRHPEISIVGGRIVLFARDPARPTAAELYELSLAFPQEMYVVERHFAATANLLTRRHVVDEIGPFDHTLLSGGDQEWGRRAHRAGHTLAYAPEVLVRHPARRTFRELSAKARRTKGGRIVRNRRAASTPAHTPDSASIQAGPPRPLARRRGRLRALVRELLPPVQQFRLFRAVAPRLSRRDSARVFALIWGLNLAQLGEAVRLRSGGAARR
jgi:glycosyltransferase involved in cell wall biosynthesis